MQDVAPRPTAAAVVASLVPKDEESTEITLLVALATR
ncbi:hypothetical protein M2167_002393 [Streptomyces sp. SPB4]|nr:hypothetical protein [Streptomyces sp. SPB4]